jgi:hypothetical protein
MTPELTELLKQAKAHVDAMTPEERDEMFIQQRLSWMRSARQYVEGDRETVVVVVPAETAPLYAHGRPNYDQIAAVAGVDRDTAKKVTLAAAYAGSPPAAPEPDYKAILIGLCAHLYLCEGRGDVGEDVSRALKLAGITPPDHIDNDSDLSDWLAIEHDAESIWVLKAPGEVR